MVELLNYLTLNTNPDPDRTRDFIGTKDVGKSF